MAVGTWSVRIDGSGPFDEDAHVLPLAVELRFVADDDVVVHGLGDSVDGELDARILHGPHEARTGPARIAAAVRLADDQLTLVRDFSVFRLVHAEVEGSGEVALLRLVAGAASDVRTALALAGDHVAVVVVRSARITVAGFASVARFRQAPEFRKTLVTVPSGDVALAHALAAVDVAALVLVSAQQVAAALLASVVVLFRKVPESVLALVAATTFHVALAVALAGHQTVLRIVARVADSVVQRSARIAVARKTNVRIGQYFIRILVKM